MVLPRISSNDCPFLTTTHPCVNYTLQLHFGDTHRIWRSSASTLPLRLILRSMLVTFHSLWKSSACSFQEIPNKTRSDTASLRYYPNSKTSRISSNCLLALPRSMLWKWGSCWGLLRIGIWEIYASWNLLRNNGAITSSVVVDHRTNRRWCCATGNTESKLPKQVLWRRAKDFWGNRIYFDHIFWNS